MLLMVLLTPSDVVSTESVVVGGGLVLTAVTLVGHATAGTEN
jgi:putative copper export protein